MIKSERRSLNYSFLLLGRTCTSVLSEVPSVLCSNEVGWTEDIFLFIPRLMGFSILILHWSCSTCYVISWHYTLNFVIIYFIEIKVQLDSNEPFTIFDNVQKSSKYLLNIIILVSSMNTMALWWGMYFRKQVIIYAVIWKASV
jgi:hypothetical protein